jgi:hypothetical protein
VIGLHHVIVGWDTYDERVLRGWLEARVNAVEAPTPGMVLPASSASSADGSSRITTLMAAYYYALPLRSIHYVRGGTGGGPSVVPYGLPQAADPCHYQ